MSPTITTRITTAAGSSVALTETSNGRRRSPSLSVCAWKFFCRGEVGDVIAASESGDFFVSMAG